MRQVPVPVAVVTTGERGITVGSLTSVSMVPPLISFNVMHASRMHAIITQARYYAVHILAEAQVEWANLFAKPDLTGPEQFAQVPHTVDADGVLLMEDTVAILHCETHAVYEVGDHSVLVGAILRTTDGPRDNPLLYHGRTYRGLGAAITTFGSR